MTLAINRPMTLEEYLHYDDGTDTHCELVDGVLVEMPPESRLNHRIASFLFGAFLRLGISTDLLTIGVQIAIYSPNSIVRQPDFVMLSADGAAALESASSDVITATMPPPALVIEVVSPGEPGEKNYERDYVEKRREYALPGIPEYWIIDPTRQVVLVLTLNGQIYQEQRFVGEATIVSPSFPQLQVTAEQILSAGKTN